MNRTLKLLSFCMMALLLAGCGGGKDECMPLRCPDNEPSCRQPFPKHDYQRPNAAGIPTGPVIKLGTIGYLVAKITDVVRNTSQKVFEKITKDTNFQKVVRGLMILFIAIYGISIALGIMQPNALDLVIRIVKMGIIFYLFTSWSNFQEIVVSFFESLTNSLTTIITTAVVTAANPGSTTTVNAMDVFNFIDENVLGLLLSVRFTSIIGAILSYGALGYVIALMLFSVVLSYLWTIILAVQIFIMSSIARSLLYAISPIFIVFLLFNQTRSLFEGWLKQLINFSLQPVFLIGFLAFFNGIFFNYIDTMFDAGYKVCYSSKPSETSGQTFKLSKFIIVPAYNVMPENLDGEEGVPLNEAIDLFTLFVVIMLGQIMVKMNTWAVQAAAQLSEGTISFSQTQQANQQMSNKITKGVGDAARNFLDLKK